LALASGLLVGRLNTGLSFEAAADSTFAQAVEPIVATETIVGRSCGRGTTITQGWR